MGRCYCPNAALDAALNAVLALVLRSAILAAGIAFRIMLPAGRFAAAQIGTQGIGEPVGLGRLYVGLWLNGHKIAMPNAADLFKRGLILAQSA